MQIVLAGQRDEIQLIEERFSNRNAGMLSNLLNPSKAKKIESVLIVDNNPIDNFIGRKYLEQLEIKTILTFENAVSALEHLQSALNLPDILIVDIYMPLIDGFEFIRRYRELEKVKGATKIFIISATINPKDPYRAQKLNINFIEKPLTKRELLEILNDLH